MKLSKLTELTKSGQGTWMIKNSGEQIHLQYRELAKLAEFILLNILDWDDYQNFVKRDWYSMR